MRSLPALSDVSRDTSRTARVAILLGGWRFSRRRSLPRLPASISDRSATFQVRVAVIRGWPRKLPYRPHTGPARAPASSLSPSPDQPASSRPSAWMLTFSSVAWRPPPPEKRTSAPLAPSRSSARHTSSGACISPRAGCRRAVCGRAAARPRGVKHGSPGEALHAEHDRWRQPRAACSVSVWAGLRRGGRRCRQRAPRLGPAARAGLREPQPPIALFSLRRVARHVVIVSGPPDVSSGACCRGRLGLVVGKRGAEEPVGPFLGQRSCLGEVDRHGSGSGRLSAASISVTNPGLVCSSLNRWSSGPRPRRPLSGSLRGRRARSRAARRSARRTRSWRLLRSTTAMISRS